MNYQVIAAAQAGKHNDKRESYGDTLIIDPWGTIVGRLPGKKLDILFHKKRRIFALIFFHRRFFIVLGVLAVLNSYSKISIVH